MLDCCLWLYHFPLLLAKRASRCCFQANEINQLYFCEKVANIFLICVSKLLFAAAPKYTEPVLAIPWLPRTSHTPCAVPGHLAALFSLISVNVTLSTWAPQDSQLNGDPHNALLLTVSEAARSSVPLNGWNLEQQQRRSSSAAGAMSLPFRKELEKYKNINEDEILSKLSEDELKQLEHVLDDLDPEVSDGDCSAAC